MTDKERQYIFDSLGRLLATADRDQESIQKLISELKQQIASYEYEQIRLREDIQQTIYTSVKSSADKSSEVVVNSFKEIEKSAQLAIDKYERYSKWAIWKVIFTGAILFSIFSAMAFAFFTYYLPTPSEISNLIKRQNEYMANLEHLERVGALAKTDECNGRLCISVNKNEIENRYTNKSGEIYIIVDGY